MIEVIDIRTFYPRLIVPIPRQGDLKFHYFPGLITYQEKRHESLDNAMPKV